QQDAYVRSASCRMATRRAPVTLRDMTQIVLAPESTLRSGALRVGRFALHFAEMWLAMMAGMFVFHALAPEAMTGALHQVGMAVAMTVPMVAWMRVRGHGWR